MIMYNSFRYSDEPPCFHIHNTQATFNFCLIRSLLVAEKVTKRHWKNAGGYQFYTTWWSPASCSSTFPASGWTNSRPLQSQGLFQIWTSCVHMEVCVCAVIIIKWLRCPWTATLLGSTVSCHWFLLLPGLWKLIFTDFHLLYADDPSFLKQCRRDVSYVLNVNIASILSVSFGKWWNTLVGKKEYAGVKTLYNTIAADISSHSPWVDPPQNKE